MVAWHPGQPTSGRPGGGGALGCAPALRCTALLFLGGWACLRAAGRRLRRRGGWALTPCWPCPPPARLLAHQFHLQGKLGSESPKSVTLAQRQKQFPPARDMPTPDVRLYHRAVVVAQDVQVGPGRAGGR